MTCAEKFIPNNIELRQISSLCISKYKSTQAFALAQLGATCKHEFSKTAKEILLLKYDIWFNWIVSVETMLREKPKGSGSIAKDIIAVSDDYADEYERIIKKNPNIFDPKFAKIWIESHGLMYRYLRDRIIHLAYKTDMAFMVAVTDNLISVMENTLFELHEVDALIEEDTVFVSYDDLCLKYGETSKGSCLLVERLKIYSKYREIKDVTVKDYSVGLQAINDEKITKYIENALINANFNLLEIQ